jgi:dihydrolipoamide dehydrogenase
MTDVKTIKVDLVVLGGGPGGYTAAFRAADLGLKTVIVERYNVLGGVCLNVGCVPSKALLHATSLVDSVHQFHEKSIFDNIVSVNVDGLRSWKDNVVQTLNSGLAVLAKKRGIEIVFGVGRFRATNELMVDAAGQLVNIQFTSAIIATGSHSIQLPDVPANDAVWNSTDALQLPTVPNRLLVVGGGVIGLEMATVYQRLGSQVTVVELSDTILPGIDKSTVRPLLSALKKKCTMHLSSKVTHVVRNGNTLRVTVEGRRGAIELDVDAMLIAVGRRPNTTDIGLEKMGVSLNGQGFIPVDVMQRTNLPHVFAIGDVTPGPMLAHRASAEGRVAAEVASGMASRRLYAAIPQVAYTSPEVATVGMSEKQAEESGVEIDTGKFPFAANARAMTLDEAVGFVKIIFEKRSGVVVGAEVVGPNAGELIVEATLAVQNRMTVHQLTQTVHPHPGLSESVVMAAEVFEGTVTDLFIPRKVR